MLPRIGLPEMMIVLVIALLVFGPGRIVKVAGELGRGIGAFQSGLKGVGKTTDENGDNTDA